MRLRSQDPLSLTAHTRAYTYNVTEGPDELPVTLQEVKDQLRIFDDDNDDLLTLYIEAATEYAENFTRRHFITRTNTTYRDFFPGAVNYYGYYAMYPYYSGNLGFEIRRSPLQSIETIEYLVQGVLTLVDDTVYYNTLQNDYSVVLSRDDQFWPNNADEQLQSILITFKTGIGNTSDDIPANIQLAIMQIVTAMYENRGDCAVCDCAQFVPPTAKHLLQQIRIENL